MKLHVVIAFSAIVLASAHAQPAGKTGEDNSKKDSAGVTVARKTALQSSQGPDEYFTGSARIESLFAVVVPSRVAGARVTFEPGARTAWHTHPLGQVLIVTAGRGWVQHWGGPVQEIREGDVVRIPPGQKHWHGATATTQMTHIALQEQLNGRVVEWMEKVSEEQYQASPRK
jgi:quercetin dioxygenase-like cupin family protein